MILEAVAAITLASADPRIMRPPTEFRNRDAIFLVEMVDIGQVDRRCRERGASRPEGRRVEACSSGILITMPRYDQMSPGRWVQLLEHEIGHVLLWPGNHPGGK